MAAIAAVAIGGYLWNKRGKSGRRHHGTIRTPQGDPRFSVKKTFQQIESQQFARSSRLVTTNLDPVYHGRGMQLGRRVGASVRVSDEVLRDHGAKRGIAQDSTRKNLKPWYQPNGIDGRNNFRSRYHQPTDETLLQNRLWRYNNVPNPMKALHLTTQTGMIPQKA